MISEEMRKRIAALNRRDLKHEVEAGDEEGASKPDPQSKAPRKKREPTVGARVPEPKDVQIVATAADARLRLTLQEVAPGQEICNEAGQFLMIEKSIQDLLHGGGGWFQTRYEQIMGAFTAGLGDGSFDALLRVRPEDVMYVDIETTGLTAGTPLFLIGVLGYSEGVLRVQQLLARDYTEEPALLMHFSDLMQASRVLVSFNGRTYDLPYIRDRSVFMGVPFQLQQVHIDMLHVARRLWKRRLPNCKLQTLEQYLCKRVRRGDIPGAEIPDAYHRFVQSGNAVQMRDILHHNALDLLTTAEVLTFVLEGREL